MLQLPDLQKKHSIKLIYRKKIIFKRPPELRNETNTMWCFAFIVVSFRKLLTIMHFLKLKWTFQVQKVQALSRIYRQPYGFGNKQNTEER